MTATWRKRTATLKQETYALYLAARDPRTPWYAKALVAAVAAYAVSPIDLIPDFIPILGYLDDLILVPLGIWLALKMIPAPVMAECRTRAMQEMADLSGSRTLTTIILLTWLGAITLTGWAVWRTLR